MDRKWLSERAQWLKKNDFLDYATRILPGKSRIGTRLLEIISDEKKRADEMEVLVVALANSDVNDLTPEIRSLYDKYTHELRLQGVRV